MTEARDSGEGDIVVVEDDDALDMTDVRDIRLLHWALTKGWPLAQDRAERYMMKLDRVMEGASDEKVIIAGAAVAQRMLKTYLDTIKVARDKPAEHKHLHLHGQVDPRDMSDEDLDAYIAEQRSRIAGESRSGTES